LHVLPSGCFVFARDAGFFGVAVFRCDAIPVEVGGWIGDVAVAGGMVDVRLGL
jgi:hypothetical protein